MGEYLTPSGRVVLLDDEDLAGLPGKISIGSHGYAQVCGVERGRVVLLHRWLLGLEKRDRRIGDHIDRNKLDCRRSTLRVVDPSASSQNVTRRAGNVYPTKNGKWLVQFKKSRKNFRLGIFDDYEEARQIAEQYRNTVLPYADGRDPSDQPDGPSGSAPELFRLARMLEPWRCCGDLLACGARCREDEISDLLARAERAARERLDAMGLSYGTGVAVQVGRAEVA